MCFSREAIHQQFKESNVEKELDELFLLLVKNHAPPNCKVSELQQVLRVNASKVRAAILTSPLSLRDDPAYHCYLVLRIWKDQGHHTYGDLRSALEKYSVFCGRHPLVLAGGSTHATKDVDQSLNQKPSSSSHSHRPTSKPPTKPTPQSSFSSGQSASGVLQSEQQPQIHRDDRRPTMPQRSDRPTLKDLQLLKCRGGRRLKVIEGVAPDWKHLATSLGIEGPVIRSIEMGAFFQPEEACRQVFIKWLEGDSLREPVTWGTLIQCLIEAGLVDIAEELEEVLGIERSS